MENGNFDLVCGNNGSSKPTQPKIHAAPITIKFKIAVVMILLFKNKKAPLEKKKSDTSERAIHII